jgi:hypothetical protein
MTGQEQISIQELEDQEAKTLLNNLALTPEERLINHQKALNLMTTLQNVRKEVDAERPGQRVF